jgi:hypothetical protein
MDFSPSLVRKVGDKYITVTFQNNRDENEIKKIISSFRFNDKENSLVEWKK